MLGTAGARSDKQKSYCLSEALNNLINHRGSFLLQLEVENKNTVVKFTQFVDIGRATMILHVPQQLGWGYMGCFGNVLPLVNHLSSHAALS